MGKLVQATCELVPAKVLKQCQADVHDLRQTDQTQLHRLC